MAETCKRCGRLKGASWPNYEEGKCSGIDNGFCLLARRLRITELAEAFVRSRKGRPPLGGEEYKRLEEAVGDDMKGPP